MFINFGDIFKGFRCVACKYEFSFSSVVNADPDNSICDCPNCEQKLSTHISNTLFAVILIYLSSTVGLTFWAVLNLDNLYIAITIALLAVISYFIRNLVSPNGYITLHKHNK